MLPLITPQHMLERERAYFAATGVKSIDVMERAAQALAEEIAARVNEGSTLLFACGPGGNGGDGGKSWILGNSGGTGGSVAAPVAQQIFSYLVENN